MCRWASGSAAAWIRPAWCITRPKHPARVSRRFPLPFAAAVLTRRTTRARWRTAYGTEHTELDLNPEQDLPGAIQELAYYCDEPNADSGALPVWFLSRLTKASATVALSGEGADELFGGYLMQRASLLARTARRLPRAGAAGDAGARPTLAGVQRQDRIRIQAEAVSGRLPDAGGARPCVLERNVRRSGKALAGSARAAAGARFRFARTGRGGRHICRPISGSIRNTFFRTIS